MDHLFPYLAGMPFDITLKDKHYIYLTTYLISNGRKYHTKFSISVTYQLTQSFLSNLVSFKALLSCDALQPPPNVRKDLNFDSTETALVDKQYTTIPLG